MILNLKWEKESHSYKHIHHYGYYYGVLRVSLQVFAAAAVEAVHYKFYRKTLGKWCFMKRTPQTSFGR